MFEGKRVAFIASGGGSRGIAHAGVIKACEDFGINFDILIGVSAGAIGMVMYSAYGNIDMVLDNFRPKKERRYDFSAFNWTAMLSFKNFFKPSIKSGIFDLSGAESFFAKNLPVDRFFDLPKPTYVAATNLGRGEGVLFGPDINNHVPISKALVASSCVPVIFRPVEIDGEYYIDGEIKRPLSIETAIQKGADIIIVSDIYSPCVKDIGTSNMLNIASQIGNMLLGDKSLRGIKICRSLYPDKEIILISPHAGDISMFNSREWAKLEMIGYNSAKKVLMEYQEEL